MVAREFKPLAPSEFESLPLLDGRMQVKHKLVDEATLDEFLLAKNKRKISTFAAKHLDFFGISPLFADGSCVFETQEDFARAREVLKTAMSGACLLRSDTVSWNNVSELGICPISLTPEQIRDTRKKLESTAEKISLDLDGVGSFLKIPDNAIGASFMLCFDNAPYYSAYLNKACESMKAYGNNSVYAEAVKGRSLSYLDLTLGWYPNTHEGARMALQKLVDDLFTLHMTGIRTICIEGEEERVPDSTLSMLWWLALGSMRSGKLGKCIVCGTPYTTRKLDRGTPRKYCSDACRQWANKHPGETR